MPPLLYETAAWLRFYVCLPIPRLPGETEEQAAPDPARTAHAVPIAGALIGAVGGIVLLVAGAWGLPAFLSAALALAAIVIVTGGLAERALAVSAERLGGQPAAAEAGTKSGIERVSYGAIALVLAVLLRVGALTGLMTFGAFRAALALVAAAALSRAAAISYVLTHPPERPEGEAAPGGTAAALQWLAIVALVVVAAAILPAYGVIPAVAALAAAVAASAIVAGVAARFAPANRRELSGTTEQTAEIAFLLALIAFAPNL